MKRILFYATMPLWTLPLWAAVAIAEQFALEAYKVRKKTPLKKGGAVNNTAVGENAVLMNTQGAENTHIGFYS